jgi:hypothetical protein
MGNTNVAALGATAQAQNQQNANTIQNTIETNKINAGVSAQNANTNAALAGGLMNAAGAAVGLAKGGTVPKLSGGGDPFPDYSHMYTAGAEGFSKGLGSMADRERKSYGAAEADKSSVDKIIAGLPEPSTTPYTMPEGVVAGPPAMAHGGHLGALLRMIDGGHIPGVATHPGDNLKNDTQPAMLSPGEYVEPRSVVKKPGMKQALEAVRKNPDLASEFVKMVRAKQGKRA